MPFVKDRPLEDHFDERAAGRATRRIADALGDRLERNTKARTPVGDGRSRPAGTMRESIRQSPVTPVATLTGSGWGGRLFTNDPAAPHVEWNTRPHDIPGAFGIPEPFGIGGRFAGKFHPGTTGQHMFSLGAAETEAQLRELAGPALEVFRREVVR